MFGFLKHKKNLSKQEPRARSLSTAKKAALLQHIEQLKSQLEQSTTTGLAEIYERLGCDYEQLGETSLAIEYLEKSQRSKKSLGKGYKVLLNLYNQERVKAAKEKDEATLQYYLNKLDELLTLSKEMTRGAQK
ncbi:tetratricopeptide repeat protein [Vagococcus entomophilus]|uniref:Tetratricopeptide repeat protein n=1 Tax=Vagococcus entomophilus TaxID=1160095 RepID=A0A430AKJ0_9ENTE|nr:tetratricopeptide repeat protein [Vagococcus entomophilus]RSU08630.1 hypothetical protein CBF30_05230 [Vagococcus entomophilus]